MKAHNKLNETGGRTSLGAACLASCRKLGAQTAEVKRSIVREFEMAMAGHRQMINAAVNEAEALAWQTPYPHLLFPGLAWEKAAAAKRWAWRQQRIRQAGPVRPSAA